MSDRNPSDVCKTCDNTREWHSVNLPRHPFNDDGSFTLGDAKEPEIRENGPQWPLDPVLRQALIDKGVLTPQDLRDAEEKIRAITADFQAVTKESRRGK